MRLCHGTILAMKKNITFAFCFLLYGCGSLPGPTPPLKPTPQKEAAAPQFSPVDIGTFTQSYLGAVVAESSGDLAQSAAYYFNAMKDAPNSRYLLEAAFTYQLAVGNVETAVDLAQRLDNMGGSTPVSFLMLAAKAAKEGNLAALQQALDKSQALSTELLQFELAKAYIALERGDEIEKIVATLKAYTPHPSLAPYQQFHIARLYELAGNTQQALVFYELAAEKDPGSIFNTLQLGRLYEEMGEQEKAADIYTLFDAVKPSSTLLLDVKKRLETKQTPPKFKATLQENIAEVLFGLGTLMTNPETLLASQQMMHIAKYLAPTHNFAAFYVANLADRRQDYAAAAKHYAQVPPQSPAWFAAQLRLADVLVEDQKGREAKAVLRGMIDEYANQYQLYQALGDIYYAEKKYQRAIRYYQRALAAVETPTTAHAALFFSLGGCFERLGDFSRATENLQMALNLSPNNPAILNYLGYMWLEQNKNLEQATTYITQALLLQPGDGAITDSLGWAYYKQGNYKKAVRLLERAAELLPNDPTINSHLGDVYEKLERFDEARTHWQRALDLGLENATEVQRMQQKLEEM